MELSTYCGPPPTNLPKYTDDMPLLELTIKYMASNHFPRGNLVLCMGVLVVMVN